MTVHGAEGVLEHRHQLRLGAAARLCPIELGEVALQGLGLLLGVAEDSGVFQVDRQVQLTERTTHAGGPALTVGVKGQAQVLTVQGFELGAEVDRGQQRGIKLRQLTQVELRRRCGQPIHGGLESAAQLANSRELLIAQGAPLHCRLHPQAVGLAREAEGHGLAAGGLDAEADQVVGLGVQQALINLDFTRVRRAVGTREHHRLGNPSTALGELRNQTGAQATETVGRRLRIEVGVEGLAERILTVAFPGADGLLTRQLPATGIGVGQRIGDDVAQADD